MTYAKTGIQRAKADLLRMTDAFMGHLSVFGPSRLGKEGTFSLLRKCVNYSDPGVRLKEDEHLDYHMGDERVQRSFRSIESVGVTPVQILSMKTAPAGTFALMFEEVYTIPSDLIVCLRWRRESTSTVRRALTTMQNMFHTLAVVGRGRESIPNPEKEALKKDISEALGEMALGSHFYGTCSMTVVCLGEQAEQAAERASRSMAQRDGAFIRESVGSLLAWLSIVPGNVDTDVRGLRVLEAHAADMSSLFSISQGARESAYAGRGPIAVFDTPSGVPYYFSPYVRDVGNRFTCGNIGSGKTTLEAMLLSLVTQYDPQIIVLDFGQGYRRVGEHFGASYMEFGMGSTVAMNPLDQPDSKDHRQFVHTFVKMLIEGTDGYKMLDAQERLLEKAVAAVMSPNFSPEQRRLTGVYHMYSPPYNARLQKWIEGGRYGHLFDHVKDELGLNPFQIFELEAMKAHSNADIKGPLLSYLFRLADLAVHRGNRPVVVLLADASEFLSEPIICKQVVTGLDTWRKYDGSLILETQSIDQLQKIDPKMATTVIQRCETMLFLPNPRVDHQAHKDLFGFNYREIQNLIALKHKQVLLRRNGVSRILNVTIDPDTIWMYQSPVSQRTAMAGIS